MTSKKIRSHNDIEVFQFTHPGAEHSGGRKVANGVNFKVWNYSAHKRKYIRSLGEYIDKNGILKESYLDFWGEWEPDSIVFKLPSNGSSNKELPKFIQHPVFLDCNNYKTADCEDKMSKKINELKAAQIEKKSKNKALFRQNTDPFVFGNQFMYSSICKAEEVLDMKPGSIILFGSTKNRNDNGKETKKYYRIDTVFVIKDIIDFDSDIKKQYKETVYYKAALNRIYTKDKFHDQNNVQYTHKLFFGATVNDPINGMYSFAPANISSNTPHPPLQLDEKVFPEVKQNIFIKGQTIVSGEKETKLFWERLLNYTYDNGYVPASRFSEPPIFKKTEEISAYISDTLLKNFPLTK